MLRNHLLFGGREPAEATVQQVTRKWPPVQSSLTVKQQCKFKAWLVRHSEWHDTVVILTLPTDILMLWLSWNFELNTVHTVNWTLAKAVTRYCKKWCFVCLQYSWKCLLWRKYMAVYSIFTGPQNAKFKGSKYVSTKKSQYKMARKNLQ